VTAPIGFDLEAESSTGSKAPLPVGGEELDQAPGWVQMDSLTSSGGLRPKERGNNQR